MEKEAYELVNLLTERGLQVSCAESCTGGMCARMITDVPGASAVFEGGAVTYSNRIKHKLLGVSEEVLRIHGAVSSECACGMASGVRELYGADIAFSLTGIAGPGGGTPDKPVGTVYLGISTKEATYSRLLTLSGNREEIRRQAALEAMRECLFAVKEL